MLSPRLTNCPECANIPSLLKKIDCKLAELGNSLYNNVSYMLNQPIPAGDILQLIAYRRILTHKYCNPNYVHEYSVAMIASRVIRITVGCVSRCNEPERCLEDPCEIDVVANPTTTSTTTLTSCKSYILYNTATSAESFLIGNCDTGEPETITLQGLSSICISTKVALNVSPNIVVMNTNECTTTTTSTSSTSSTTTTSTTIPPSTTTTTSSSSTSTTTSSSTSTSTTTSTTTLTPTTTTTSSSSSSTTTTSSSSTSTTTSSSTSTSTTTSTTTSTPFINYGFNTSIYKVAMSDNDSLYVGGAFTLYGTTNASRIIKLNDSGTPDTSFVYGAGFNGTVYDILEQPDGKIVVVGAFTIYNTIPAAGIIRLNPDGTRDTSFVYGTGLTGLTGEGYRIARQSDGKLIVGAQASQYNGTPIHTIVRLNPDGSFDNTFALTIVTTPTTEYVFPDLIVVDTDDKFFVAWDVQGNVNSFFINGVDSSYVIYKFNADGTTDTSFTSDTLSSNFRSKDVIIKSDGKILVGGQLSVKQYNSDGTTDPGFNTVAIGSFGTSIVTSLQIDVNSNILIGGNFDTVNGFSGYNNVARLYSDGTVDNTFVQGTGFTNPGPILDIAKTSVNKFYFGGSYIYYNNNINYYLSRFNSNGTLNSINQNP